VARSSLPPRPSAAAGKWLTASVTDDIAAVIAAGFGEAARRDPGHRRIWIALAGGNKQQSEAIRAEATRRHVIVHIICDLIHVLEYTGRRPGPSSSPATPALKPGSLSRLPRSSPAKPPPSWPAPPPRRHLRLLTCRT
jgi:hypothetical protein